MINIKHFNRKHYLFNVFIALFLFSACGNPPNNESGMSGDVVDVLTENMEFQMKDTLKAGWNTFRYQNNSQEVHFILLDKYPVGKTIEDGKKEIMPVFQNGMNLINEGRQDEAMAEFGKLPPWFSEVVFCGGTGLLSPGRTGESTIRLDKGYYVMECYVKMANGSFHAVMGMTKAFIVEDTNSTPPPEATVNISISGTEGISVSGDIKKGENVFSVYFEDQKVHENFVGHDINLVKLDSNADTEELEKWMNWADPEGLITPAPPGITFLGGVNDSPAGSMGYFRADLSPGKYALISEVPKVREKNLLKLFEVSD